ncbi:Uncharacterised protein [Neisseria canis]|uniref:Transposase n=2 Tax=Neisseria canis TaxID=493 RepID=A0A3S4NXK7_9NEIS|nr:Uncharacterised protein [Neisseria canis]
MIPKPKPQSDTYIRQNFGCSVIAKYIRGMRYIGFKNPTYLTAFSDRHIANPFT